jgi:superfamily II DNA or RNA helicase
MTKAIDIALAAFETAVQVTPDLLGNDYPSRMSEFIKGTLGANIWEKQIEIADAVDDHRYVAVASCHGAGKSHIAARIALAFLHTRPRSIVLTTAPTARQVQHVLWREINSA